MSNEVSLFQPGALALPADVLAAASAASADFSGGLGSSFRRIALRSGRFRLIEGGVEQVIDSSSISVGVLGSSDKVRRQFFMGVYEAGSKEPPTCWSNDGERPDNAVPGPQRQSNACATCRQNEKGSANNGEGRACAFRKTLVVAMADNGEGGLLNPNTPVRPWMMAVNAMSMFGESKPQDNLYTMAGLARRLAEQRTPQLPKGIPVTAISVDLVVDQDASVPKIWFRPIRFLPVDAIRLATAAAVTAEVKDMLAMSMANVAEVEGPTTERHFPDAGSDQAARTPPPAAAKPAPAAAPVQAVAPAPVQPAPAAAKPKMGWKDFAAKMDVDASTVATVEAAGGPGTDKGRKLWNVLVEIELPTNVDVGIAAPAPAPAPAAAVQKKHWRQYGEEVGADNDDLDMVESLGGLTTASGRKYWDKVVGADLGDDIDIGGDAPAAAAPVPAATEQGKAKRGRPTKAEQAAKAAAAAAAETENPAPQEASVATPAPVPVAAPVAAPVATPSIPASAASSLASMIEGFGANFDD